MLLDPNSPGIDASCHSAMSAETPQADALLSSNPQDETNIGPAVPHRARTNTAEIDNTIIHPGSVKINVTGAFIVDQDSGAANLHENTNGGSHDSKDIRLPYHTAVVSHIAVDVCHPSIPVDVHPAIPSFLVNSTENIQR